MVGNSKASPGSVFDYFNLMFSNQAEIHSFANTGKWQQSWALIYSLANDTQLIEHVTKILKTDSTFGPFADQFQKGFDDGNMDWLARVDWKFACSVGTSGTPFPYINRVFLDAGIADFDLADWRKIIDPMLTDPNDVL